MRLYFITGGILYGGKLYGLDTDRQTWAMADTTDAKKKRSDIKPDYAFIKIDRLDAMQLEASLDASGWRYDSDFDKKDTNVEPLTHADGRSLALG